MFLDLDKLNELIKDNSISSIQCDGPNSRLKVFRGDDLHHPDIHLEEREIRKIINKFSTRTNAPLGDTVFRTKFGNLKLIAIPSALKFLIQKI
ncbi:MAG: hypothetical protein ABH817_02340 [archaeon]